MNKTSFIEISIEIDAPLSAVWQKWISVEGVQHWGFASDDWAAEGIENNVTVGGAVRSRNFAKDGSFEFMLEGTYTTVDPEQLLAYTLSDGRQVEVHFLQTPTGTSVRQRFEPENQNPESMQKQGWQAYLDNFKKYAESSLK